MRPLVVAAVAAVALLAPRSGAAARVMHATPANYLARLAGLGPGDTLLLAPGEYENAAVPGLPVFDLHGTPDAPITIAGPRSGRPAVLIGQAAHNTVRIANASHVVIRDLTIDGRDRGGDGVNAEGARSRTSRIVVEGDPDHVQRADVNVVFAEPAIVARNQLANLVGPYEDAPRHLVNPLVPPGQLDLTPRPRAARGPPIDVGEWRSFTDWNRDFDGRARRWTIRGAYSIDGPAIRQRNERKSGKARGPRANRTAHLATQAPGVATRLDRAVNAPGTWIRGFRTVAR